jgi:hypothetical protein
MQGQIAMLKVSSPQLEQFAAALPLDETRRCAGGDSRWWWQVTDRSHHPAALGRLA